MLKRFVLVLGFFAVSLGAARADTVLQRVADGVNVGQIKTLQYTGNGMMFELGQHATPIAPLPRFYVKSLTRVIDFNSAAMREEVVRTQGEQPLRGGGIQPTIGEQRLIGFVHGDYAWNEAGKDMLPRLWDATNRQHQIWVTPQGFVRAALANEAATKSMTVDGRKMTVISFTIKGKIKADGYVNDENLIERIESWYGNPVTVTHEINRAYFERAAANSRNFSPDRLAKSGKKAVFQAMGDNMVLTDGTRSVELCQIVGNAHHQGLVMAYLRK